MFVQCIGDEEMVSKVADDVVLLQSVYKQLVPWLPLVEAVTGGDDKIRVIKFPNFD